jgi:hypothetical protein
MNEHTVMAALGVATGIVAAFIVWTYVGPMLTSSTASA